MVARETGTAGKARVSPAEIRMVALICLVAAALRLYKLPHIPPGLFQDEAVNGISALKVLSGLRPIAFGTREPLYIYLLAGMSRLLGADVISLRLVSAILGMLSIPLLWALGRRLFGREAAIFAAIGLATSFWHISFSQIIFRAILLVPLEIAFLYFLWRGWEIDRHGRGSPWASFLISGLFLGLSLYSYIPARTLPLLAFLFFVLQGRHRRTFFGLAMTMTVAMAIFAPLGLYYLQHPEDFLGRLTDVFVVETASLSPTSFFRNVLVTLGMFNYAGDYNWRHNIAGWPVFGPVSGAFFLGGLALSFRRLREARSQLVLIWFALMLLPGIASASAPHYLRTLGAAPPAYLIFGLGVARAWCWLDRRLQRPPRSLPTFYPLALIALIVCAALAYHLRFRVWAPRLETATAFNSQSAQLGRFLARLEEGYFPPPRPSYIYISRRLIEQATPEQAVMSFYVRARAPGLAQFDEGSLLPLPPATGRSTPALYVLPGRENLAAQMLERIGEPEIQTQREGHLLTYRLEVRDLSSLPLHQLQANFGNLLELRGYQLLTPINSSSPTETLHVILHWKILDTPEGGLYSTFAHLKDEHKEIRAISDGLGYPTWYWQTGERLISLQELRLPPGRPGGSYSIEVGAYRRQDGRRLKLLSPEGIPPRDRLELTRLELEAQRLDPAKLEKLAVPQTLNLELVEGLRLLDYRLSSPVIKPGQELPVSLYWYATQPLSRDYLISLELTDGRSPPIVKMQSRPAGGSMPTKGWQAGTLLEDRWRLPVPARMSAATGELWVAVLDGATGEKLARVNLGKVKVASRARLFTPSPIQHRQEAALGEKVAFLGYDIAPGEQGGIVKTAPGQELEIVLYWQAQREMERSYTVFLQLLNSQGQLVVQRDSIPMNGEAPTTTWLPGEVIKDEYRLFVPPELPPGEYTLIVGMYIAETGQRLPLAGGGDHIVLSTKVVLSVKA